jgi:hypothetical protein
MVQSNRFRRSKRRVVVPLVAAEEFGVADSDVGPHFVIDDRPVVLDPLQITNVPRDALGVGSGYVQKVVTRASADGNA